MQRHVELVPQESNESLADISIGIGVRLIAYMQGIGVLTSTPVAIAPLNWNRTSYYAMVLARTRISGFSLSEWELTATTAPTRTRLLLKTQIRQAKNS